MDRQPPTTFYDSELDDSSSTASSPLSVSSVDISSPYDASRLSEEDVGSLSAVSSASPSSRSDSPGPERTAPAYNCYASKSVRWFRDDRGLWSERASCLRRTSTPYGRGSPFKSRPAASSESDRTHVSEVLIEAVRRADHGKLHQVLAKSAACVNHLGHEGDSPLHRSCRLGNLDAVKLLVRYGADTELTNREGWSPLHLAVHSGFQDVAVYLLSVSRR